MSLLIALLILLSLFGCVPHYKQVSLQEDYLKSVDTIKFCLSCHDKEQDISGTNPPYIKNTPVMLAGGDFGFVEKFPDKGHNLSCLDCHAPHASGNYRNLKTEINKKLTIVKAEGDKKYIRNKYISGMNNFCTSCHTKFLPKATKSPYDMHPVGVAVKGIDKFDTLIISIEESDGRKTVFCLSCHYAHAGPYFKALVWNGLKENTLCLECHPR
ncbi:MAG: cytochrome c3 family protein [Nitrospirota bacterium]